MRIASVPVLTLEKRMKNRVAMVVLGISLTSSAALAQERAGDAALGALSGAVVLGPVGAVAGALVGYAAGPSIAHSWGLRRSSNSRATRRAVRQETATSIGNQPAQSSQTPATTQPQPPASKSASTAPPVQGLE